VVDDSLVNNMFGSGFEYTFIPASGRSSGIVVAWRLDRWMGTSIHCTDHMVTIRLASASLPSTPWRLTTVYGPPNEPDKASFLQELRTVPSGHIGAWLICGDFNLVYKTSDKNNPYLN
jgi:hypothetical protein